MNKEIQKLIEQRLIKGEQKYGNENVTNDGRDFVKEALEEALDCTVYLAARLVEIENNNNKGETMGAKINMENRQDVLEHRLKLVEDALEEMIQTKVHHVDLTDINNVRAEGLEVKPDEEFTPPAGKRKKTTKSKDTVVA